MVDSSPFLHRIYYFLLIMQHSIQVASCHSSLCFSSHQQCSPRFAPELAPEARYGTEGTLVITPLSHPQVCSVAWCEPMAAPFRPERDGGTAHLRVVKGARGEDNMVQKVHQLHHTGWGQVQVIQPHLSSCCRRCRTACQTLLVCACKTL